MDENNYNKGYLNLYSRFELMGRFGLMDLGSRVKADFLTL